MKTRVSASLLLSTIMVVAMATTLYGQTTPVAPPSDDPITLLPASDMIVVLDVRRILTEAAPRALAKSPATLAEMNKSLDQLKAATGFDVRMVDRIVVGASSLETGSIAVSGNIKGEIIAIARGRFNAGALVAAARLLMSGKYREETYSGKALYTLNVAELSEQPSPIPGGGPAELSITVLDLNTLALGTPKSVRAAMDGATMTTNRATPELVALATRDPNALVSFSFNTEALMKRSTASAKKGLPLDSIDKHGSSSSGGSSDNQMWKELESIKQFYLSAGMTATDYNVLMLVHTYTEEQAIKLNEMISGIKTFSSGITDPSARKALDSLKIIVRGNEIQMSAVIAQADMASFIQTIPVKKRAVGTAPARRSPKLSRRRRVSARAQR